MDEYWRSAPGFEGYYDVSNHGRVRSWKRGKYGRRMTPKLMKGSLDSYGYPQVNIDGGKRLVHTLVAKAFLGERPKGYEVNHIDGIKTNNRVDNLEYVTKRENMIHARDNENCGDFRKSMDRQRIEGLIRDLTFGKATQDQIAEKYGVATKTVNMIWRGRSWKDLPRRYPAGVDYRNWRRMQKEARQQQEKE